MEKERNKFHEKIYRMNEKKLNIISAIIFIITFILYIISFIVKTNISYALFWSFITVCLLCNVILLLFWDTRGKTLDLKKSKAINRTFDDLTTVSLVLSSLIYLVVIFLEMIDESISHNILATTVTFILITMSYIFNRLAVYKAKEGMAKLAEKISGIK